MPKSKYKKDKKMYMSGGSIMVPPEREDYLAGGLAVKLGKFLKKRLAKGDPDIDAPDETVGSAATAAALLAGGAALNEYGNSKEYREKIDKLLKEKRENKAEGGSIMMPPEMAMDMPVEEESIEEPMMDVPVDTYPNADPEEVEASQESDEVIEQDQMEMVIEKALDSKEQEYLMNALEGDEQLSQIFDKVLLSASEFSGSGEVDGLGDGTSDSIPARLSDGEFVMTQKATEQIGADNLQAMMDDAERAYDGGMMRKDLYGGGLLPSASTDSLESNTRNTDDEIRKLMSLRANQAPSLR